MNHHHHVEGSCSCGRNRYVIYIPETDATSASVYLDSTSASRRSHATPLQAFLAIPLEWFNSSTIAYFPDETHSSIRRTYHTSSQPSSTTSPEPSEPSRSTERAQQDDEGEEQHTQKTFCGYCGTPLTTWSEESSLWEQPLRGTESRQSVQPSAPSHPADWIAVTLGSLLEENMQTLDELGILPKGDEESSGDETDTGQRSGDRRDDTDGVNTVTRAQPSTTTTTRTTRTGQSGSSPETVRTSTTAGGGRGMPWFEELVEDSGLGRIRRRRGGHSSANESVHWEVVEIDGGGDGSSEDAAGSRTTKAKKRKVGADNDADDARPQEDVEMHST